MLRRCVRFAAWPARGRRGDHMNGPTAAPPQGWAPPPMPAAPPPAPPGAPLAKPGPAILVGRVFGRAFSVWMANFVPFTVVTLVIHLPVILMASFTPDSASSTSSWTGLVRIVSGLAGLVLAGALTSGVLGALRGQPATVGALLSSGFSRFGDVFGASFRVGLWVMLGFVLLIVPGVMWYCALYVAVPAAVVERHLGTSNGTLQRSRELTAGSRWQIFGLVLLVALVTLVATLAAGALAVLGAGLPQPVVVGLAMTLVTMVNPLGACAHAVVYHDLRVAKEGVSTADLARVFE